MNSKHLTLMPGALLLLLCLSFSFVSCKDDSEPLYEGYGLVNKNADNKFTILLDDGNLLYPSQTVIHPERLRDSMRLYTRFNILDETDSCAHVRIVYADTILTKSILPYQESILDSVGNDPVKITKYWFAHGFLNFEFAFAGRYYMNSSYAHMVNLLQQPSDGNKLLFEFRHNDFNDKRDKIYIGVVSFPIEKLIAGMERPVKMDVKYYDSANTNRTIELNYK